MKLQVVSKLASEQWHLKIQQEEMLSEVLAYYLPVVIKLDCAYFPTGPGLHVDKMFNNVAAKYCHTIQS